MEKKLFSIVIPVYKNEQNLPVTIPYMLSKLSLFKEYDVEIILVNDGSPDNSWEIMKKYHEENPDIVKIAKLTRNFGQDAAMRCGMDLARGDVVGMISADMQDPFELFVDMLNEWENGRKIVIATRSDRDEHGIIAFFSVLYNKFMHRYVNSRYPNGGFDFLIMDREVVDKYKSLDFNYGFEQSLVLWLGYEYKEIKYVRKRREIGKSGYSFWGKFEIALGNIVTQTDLLFNIMLAIGCLMFFGGGIMCVIDLLLLIFNITNINIVIDMALAMCVFCGTIQISLAVVGKYVWYIMGYTKNNPSYVIDEYIS